MCFFVCFIFSFICILFEIIVIPLSTVLVHCTPHYPFPLCSFLFYSILFSMFYNFLLHCVLFSFSLLSWTEQPYSPERSLRNSGSTLPLLLPAVSKAYKQAGVCIYERVDHCACVCVCVCVRVLTLKLPLSGGLLWFSQLIANTDGPGAFLSVYRSVTYMNTPTGAN